MTAKNNTNTKNQAAPASIIIKAGLIAGTLDICAAFLYSYLKRGTSPVTILQYLAKFVFGKDAITDTTMLSITGLLVHFLIAMSWAVLFFILYPRLGFMRINKIGTGIVYGLFVWIMMNIVFLPLWSHKPFVFNAESSTINAVILILAIGMPLAFIANGYYSKKENQVYKSW